jgi:hypothetical protein
VMNDLAYKASGLQANRGNFGFLETLDVPGFSRCTV